MAKDYQTLNDLYGDAVRSHPDNRLFGTKRDGSYRWIIFQLNASSDAQSACPSATIFAENR